MLLIKQYNNRGVAWVIDFKTEDEAVRTMLNLAYEEEDEAEILGNTLYYNGSIVYEYGDNGATLGDYSYNLIPELDYYNLRIYGEKLDSTCEGTVMLYELDSQKYVVLQDNTVITFEEDESFGSSFPDWLTD